MFPRGFGTRRVHRHEREVPDERRQEIYKRYEAAFAQMDAVERLRPEPGGKSALHLYLLLLNPETLSCSRGELLAAARKAGVEMSVNYVPIHLFSYYRNRFCSVPGSFPNAEYCGENVISLPFYPAMTDRDITYVIEVLGDLFKKFRT